MKNLRYKALFMTANLAIFFSACSQDIKKIPEKEVNKQQVEIAVNFASNFFSGLKAGNAYEFKDEAIDIIKTSMTAENQLKFYDYIKNLYGDFESLEYAETWRQETSGMNIYRLKATFSNAKKLVEIRIVLDGNNKIAGIFQKIWSDILA